VHDDVSLGGPVWLAATFVILGTLLLALFVVADSLRPKRRAMAKERGREPIAIYTAVEAFFLVALVAAQVLEGISLVSAVPVIAAPFALGFGIAYLLRMVYPK
jgi:hypothetical protein